MVIETSLGKMDVRKLKKVVHQVDNANERMALPGFVDGVELYETILRRLAL